jgi:hypothetical protein
MLALKWPESSENSTSDVCLRPVKKSTPSCSPANDIPVSLSFHIASLGAMPASDHKFKHHTLHETAQKIPKW